MELGLLTPIISASAALLGVALTASVQLRSQRSNHRFQLDADAAKHERDRADRAAISALERLNEAHIKLSRLAREFSLTSVDILWRSGILESDYDTRYLEFCELVDELRAFAALWATELSDVMDRLSTETNRFWGNFKTALALTNGGKTFDDVKDLLQKAHASGIAIASDAQVAKRKILLIAADLQEERARGSGSGWRPA